MKKEFSKVLLIQESILIWIITLLFSFLAFYCVWMGFGSSLPWVSSIIVAAWGAYGVSQAFYYNKSKAENTVNGIKYETTLRSLGESALDEPMDYYYSTTENDYRI